MKGRKRTQRRAAPRTAKSKQHYRMSAETGLYVVTGKAVRMPRMVAVPDDLPDRIKRQTADEQRQLRHYLKVPSLEHLAPPPRKRGRRKKPKPE